MSHIEHRVRIAASIDEVFGAFTRYAEFPNFMKSVDLVRRDEQQPDLLYWHLSVATVPRIVATRVGVDRAARRVEWRGEEGIDSTGTVSLRPVDGGSTELSLVADFEPDGLLESVGAELGVISHRIKADLASFAAYVESAGAQAQGHNAANDVLGRGATPSDRLTDRITSGEE